MPRRGYRFVGSVCSGSESDEQQTEPREDLPQTLRTRQERTTGTTPLWFWSGVSLAATAGLILLVTSHRWMANLLRARGVTETIARIAPVAAWNQGKYVLVLPFGVSSADKSLDYLSTGIAEALTAKLRRVRGVHAASLVGLAGSAPTSR